MCPHHAQEDPRSSSPPCAISPGNARVRRPSGCAICAIDDPANSASRCTADLDARRHRHCSRTGFRVVTAPGECRAGNNDCASCADHSSPVPRCMVRLPDTRFIAGRRRSEAAWAKGRQAVDCEWSISTARCGRKTWRADGRLGGKPLRRPIELSTNTTANRWPGGSPSRTCRLPGAARSFGALAERSSQPGVSSFGDAKRGAAWPWPLDRAEALQQLDAFIDNALPHFGDFQDAMSRSRLANVSLAPVICPQHQAARPARGRCQGADAAWRAGSVSLATAGGLHPSDHRLA